MKIKQELKKLLEDPKAILEINKGNFKYLFDKIIDEESEFSTIASQAYELLIKTFPKKEIDEVAPQYQIFLHNIKGRDAKVIDFDSEYFDGNDEELEEYKSYIGKKVTIIDIYDYPESWDPDDSDQYNFDNNLWLVKTSDGKKLDYYGYNLKLL